MIKTGLLISLGRMIDVSLGTLKLKSVIRGDKLTAFILAFVEVIFYTLAASQAFKYVHEPIVLVMYALGYASGNCLGIIIDEKLSKGTFLVMVITNHDQWVLADKLRDNGFGVTSNKGYGLNGSEKAQLNVVVNKERLQLLNKIVKEHDEAAYVVNLDVKNVQQFQNNAIK